MRRFRIVVPSFLWLLGVSAWSADWLTDGGDVMRTNWQKDERIINTKNAKDIKLLWKIKLDNQPRQMHSLLPPLVIGRVNTEQRSEAGRDPGRRLGQSLRHRRCYR